MRRRTRPLDRRGHATVGGELGPRPPYPIGSDAVLVAYNAQAEVEAHLSLGWPPPRNIIDLYAEHMRLTNGLSVAEMRGVEVGRRGSLLAALRAHGLPSRESESKRAIIERILAGPPYSAEDQQRIFDYCTEDVDDAALLLEVLLPQMEPGWLDAALLRGTNCIALAHMARNGHPVDAELHDTIVRCWDPIRRGLIESVAPYGVYKDYHFNHRLFEDLLFRVGADQLWPTTLTGARKTDDETWRKMAAVLPALQPLREVQTTLSQMKKVQPLAIGPDGRARLGKRELAFRRLSLPFDYRDLASVGFGAYRSKTGRNQPKASEFLMLRANWWRTLVTPPPGHALVYADWSSQEIGIAAYLSGDPVMIDHYRSGDFYLRFGEAAGLVPPGATKQTHGAIRSMVLKPVSLGTLYGQREHAMAARIGHDISTAKSLLDAHAHTYRQFWRWTRDGVDLATLTGQIETPLGWSMIVNDIQQGSYVDGARVLGGVRETTLQNWRMQATGGDVLRVACIALVEAGLRISFPLHDAILVECDEIEADEVARVVKREMELASVAVVGDVIPVEVKIIRAGQNLRDPDRGDPMWERVRPHLGRPSAALR